MKKKLAYINSKGFTLVEMIVVIGIFAVITSIAMFNQGKLNSSILITNLAYEIALTVREAQTYGVGVRAGDAGTNFEGGYGVSFSMTNPNQIVLFADANNNYEFDPTEEVSTFLVENQRGNRIVALCRGIATNPKCIDGSSDNSVSLLNILFRRPNPEAIFLSKKDAASAVDVAGPAYIVVNTPSGDNCRVVIVEKTGQIRVDNGASGFCDNGASSGTSNYTP